MTEFLENAPEFCREKIRQAAYTESSESKNTKDISPKNSSNIQVSCSMCTVYLPSVDVCEYLMILMIRLKEKSYT